MTRLAALLACVTLAAAGCGGDGGGAADPNRALAETAKNLGEIRSGELTLKLIVDPREEGGRFGFELSGPFRLADPGELPVAEIDYTQIADDERETVTVTSTGERAYITVDGTAYELAPELADRLRAAGSGLGGGDGGESGLRELRIDRWMRDAQSSEGDEIGGDSTDKIESELEIVAAVNDLLTLAGRVGAGGEPLDDEEAQQLRNSVKNARLEVHTGTEDRLLRRLRLTAEFDPDLPEALDELARAAGASVEFELQVANPNERVQVEPPADPRPFSELGGG